MKIKKLIIIVVCLFVSYGCQKEEHKEPPPGYKILCSLDGKYFIVGINSGYKMYNYNGAKFKSYKGAMNRAWAQYEYERPPEDTTIWEKCEKKVDCEQGCD